MTDRPIELGLARPIDTTVSPLARLVDQLLALIGQEAADSQTLNTTAFRQRIQRYREDLAKETTPSTLGRLANECSSTCRDFFARAADFSAERETEIKDLIGTLTSAIDKLAGEAVSVNKQLTGHSDRFHTLAEVEDIRDLKRRISQEVSALNRFVAEKQEREDAYYSKLNMRIDALQAKLVETEVAAALDPLTQVANRGTFDQSLRRWLARAQQSQTPFVLALLDIDNFKGVNDTYGHLVGDRVLLALARALTSQVRPDDLVARYGGEEFALLMSGTSLRQAEPRIRDLIAHVAGTVYEFAHGGRTERLIYTISAGATEMSAGDTPETIVKRADDSLYEAKHRGKNCVVARKSSLFSRILGS
ncbi:MAG TPA: diguanylate cyclase [Vicinamibacterales bacterium]|jgi:diguanylate cyclase